MGLWRTAVPKGSRLYGILRSRAGGGTVLVVFADGKSIARVPPNAGRGAGYKFSTSHDGFALRGGGLMDFAKALGKFLYDDAQAFDYGPDEYF